MSKFLKIMIVMLTIAAMAAPVIAEDRLSLAGSMRVRGFYFSQDNGTTDQADAWNDSRLRIGGKIAVAEGVSVNFRFDASESKENSSDAIAWGGDTTGFAPYSNRRADIQFDKAYLQVSKGGYTLKAGQQYFRMGTGHMLDTVGAGFILNRGAVTISHVKQLDESFGAVAGNTDTGQDDTSVTSAQYKFKSDNFNITPQISYLQAGSDEELLGLAVNAAAKFGAINIKGELDFFDGEMPTVGGVKGADRKGLQLYLDASTAVSDTVTVGGIVLYAQAQDGGDVQETYMDMPVFAGFSPLTYGYQSADFPNDYEYLAALNPFEIGGKTTNAGMIALQGYANVTLSDDLRAKFAAAYAQAEDDSVKDISGFILNASASYALLKNTSLVGHINYSAFEDTPLGGGASVDTDTLAAITSLVVKF